MTKPLRFRDCACPGTPHPAGDTVVLRDHLSFAANTRALSLIYASEPALVTAAMPVYLHDGPTSWNLVDADGSPVPLTEEALDDLSFADQYEIADLGDTQYRDTVLSPLVQRSKALSQAGPTPDAPTSPSSSSRRRS